jgi:hypothetical protein
MMVSAIETAFEVDVRERVGPRDYMPPWEDMGERLEKMHPNFDVYVLGKLFRSMITGRLNLAREWHKRREYDLAKMFATHPCMHRRVPPRHR